MRQLLSALLLLCCWSTMASSNDIQPDNLFPTVVFETSKGSITIEMDRTRAPITVDNFLRYVVSGRFDNTVFHRVIKDFVVQGGGYTPKDDPVPAFDAIFNESGNGLSNEYGTIAMVREHSPHTATNEFYFNLKDNTNLDPSRRRWGYTVFGMVTEGLEVLDAMGEVPVEYDPHMGAESRPVEPLILIKATLLPEV